MRLSPSTRVGPYEIVAPLGSGGMGEVYRARATRLGREVAIKILPEAFATDPERLRRFEQEARSAAALSHPNILAVHDVGTHDGWPYLVSELLDGDSLRARTGRPMPARRAVELALQIARGLAAAHGRGIVHRDLKPENIFTTTTGLVKILDFGLARLVPAPGGTAGSLPTVGGATEAGLVMGTVGYMSPEQARGEPADHRSDIFTFGVILHELLSGRRAFDRARAPQTLTAILEDDAPDLMTTDSAVPIGLSRIVERCLHKDPGARFQSAHDLAFALEQLPEGQGAVAVAGPSAARPTRWLPWALFAAAAAGCIALSVLAYAYSRRTVPDAQAVRFLVEPPGSFTGTVSGTPTALPDGNRHVHGQSLASVRRDAGRPALPRQRAGISDLVHHGRHQLARAVPAAVAPVARPVARRTRQAARGTQPVARSTSFMPA